ncbi:MAG: Gfo/Idh/MocA family oxidoreductase [Acidobacteria bacterium]|nr:Gfo/Idh/MocA family oxidoreductase [Acidobacteriota bacterium]
MNGNRRSFLRAGAATALSYSRIRGANSRIRIAGIGTGGRCSYLLYLAVRSGTELVAVCDAYAPRRAAIREKLAPEAREYLDYHEVLGRNDIDAVFIGAPDHWHVPMTIDAVAAGKDVYVEKPVSHTIEEGERVARAVANSKQVVQVGYQQRSWEHFKAARDVIASGKLGKITIVLASWYQDYLRHIKLSPQVDTSALDWKRFLGSAPEQPFQAIRFGNWRWFWDFGGGHLTDLYSHYCDVIQWCMEDKSPRAAEAMGTRHAIPQFECPDTITAVYEYSNFQVTYSGSLACSLDGGNILFRGSNAMMKLNRDGFAVYPENIIPGEKTNYPEPEIAMRSMGDGTLQHVGNFLECVRSRKAPNTDIHWAVAAARSAHLGNRALREGARITA